MAHAPCERPDRSGLRRRLEPSPEYRVLDDRPRRRQQAEQPAGGDRLTRGRCGGCGLVKKRHVATVDFDQIVNQKHRYDAEHVNALHWVARQHQRDERDVPTMFGAVLAARAFRNAVAAEDGFEPVGLRNPPAGFNSPRSMRLTVD